MISCASPSTLTATVPTTVPITTDGQTTVGAEVGAAEVDGGRECGKSGREGKAMKAERHVSKVVQMDRSDEHASSVEQLQCSYFFSRAAQIRTPLSALEVIELSSY